MGLLPFIPGEIIKLVAAASAAWHLHLKKTHLLNENKYCGFSNQPVRNSKLAFRQRVLKDG